VRLAWAVIGILSEKNYFYLVERRFVKSIEDQRPGRVNDVPLLFFNKEIFKLRKIRFIELINKDLFPAFFYLWIHFAHKANLTKSFKNKSPDIAAGA
jgi:hypothetical protein